MQKNSLKQEKHMLLREIELARTTIAQFLADTQHRVNSYFSVLEESVYVQEQQLHDGTPQIVDIREGMELTEVNRIVGGIANGIISFNAMKNYMMRHSS